MVRGVCSIHDTWQAEINFVEGWPIQITIAASDFLRHAEDIVATIPLRHLNLTAIADAPFAQIVSLQGSHQSWSEEAIRALAGSPHLDSLRWLDLSHTDLTDAEVEILAASPRLRELAYVNLQNNSCRDPVDAAEGYGTDGITGFIVNESIWLPTFGKELEERYGTIGWLHSLGNYMERHPPSRYEF